MSIIIIFFIKEKKKKKIKKKFNINRKYSTNSLKISKFNLLNKCNLFNNHFIIYGYIPRYDKNINSIWIEFLSLNMDVNYSLDILFNLDLKLSFIYINKALKSVINKLYNNKDIYSININFIILPNNLKNKSLVFFLEKVAIVFKKFIIYYHSFFDNDKLLYNFHLLYFKFKYFNEIISINYFNKINKFFNCSKKDFYKKFIIFYKILFITYLKLVLNTNLIKLKDV